MVIALGGNALVERGQEPTAAHLRARVRQAAARIAAVAADYSLVIAHGNGPQVGLLALQAASYDGVDPYPLDILGAETEAMIGYVIEQELANRLPGARLATLLTMVEVAADDPAFEDPTKFIGQVYDEQRARELADRHGWQIRRDGEHWRRVVPSPRPQRIVEIDAIRLLADAGVTVICAGGGGIPVVVEEGATRGVEAVIDKDLAAALLAEEIGAELLVVASDVEGVFADWGGPDQRLLRATTPEELEALDLPAGSMGPKAEAVARFVRRTGRRAAIGALHDIEGLVAGHSGTQVRTREGVADG